MASHRPSTFPITIPPRLSDPMTDDELATVCDAAHSLNVTVSWVYEHARHDAEDRFPVVKFRQYSRVDRRVRERHFCRRKRSAKGRFVSFPSIAMDVASATSTHTTPDSTNDVSRETTGRLITEIAARLTRQLLRAFDQMRGSKGRTLNEIARTTGDPPASISAQLRNLPRRACNGAGGYRLIDSEAAE